MSKAGDSSASTQDQTQPADQPAHNLTSFREDNGHHGNIEQGSTSQAILVSLDRLNNNFQQFTQQFEPDEVNEFDEFDDNPQNINILADI